MSPRHPSQSTPKTIWFCPRCRKTRRDASASGLCPHCGDGLVEEGYCPVCEDFWPLAAGGLCPKHDIELESLESLAGGVDSVGSHSYSSSWMEVARFSDTLACQPARIRLEAEGIPTMIDNERMGGRFMYHVATGGVGLRVPEELVAEARIILSQTWSATAKALDLDDWDDFDDEVPTSAAATNKIEPAPSPPWPLAAFTAEHVLFLLTSAARVAIIVGLVALLVKLFAWLAAL